MRRYNREAEARRVNRIFSTEPSKVYAQWQVNKMRIDPPRAETKQYWKNLWEREPSHNTDAPWLGHLRADHSNQGTSDSGRWAYMKRLNKVAGIMYRNICTEYGLEVPKSKLEIPTKVVENDRAKIL